MNWEDLTPEQRTAIVSDARRLLVFGGAGAGKTTVALWCARQQLERAVSTSERALFLTFSKAAVRELSGRATQALGGVADSVEVHTFHSFAHRLLLAFGRYIGLGLDTPTLQSPPQVDLLGRDRSRLVYDDLLPHALTILRTPLLRRLLAPRWSIVICDEFQDTDDLQWELLNELATNARLALFADPNQMIYTFLRSRGVGPERVEAARAAADLVVDLGAPSHRDPSQVIPAMAQAVRERDFGHEAVRAALDQARLMIHRAVPADGLVDLIRDQVIEARRGGAETVAIFAHSNQSVADLGADLLGVGVEHVLVGLPEAHGEALAAMEALLRFGLGLTDRDEVTERLAVFLTSSVRGRTPMLALALIGRGVLSPGLRDRLDAVLASVQAAAEAGLEDLIREAAAAWGRLGITSGNRPWRQSARTFAATGFQILSAVRGDQDLFVPRLGQRVAELRGETLVEAGFARRHPVQLMNFHQTKGREADVVLLVYRDDDFFGHESEPFPDNSRVLYVSLTRARHRNVVLLPSVPHALVAPFARLEL